MSLHLRRGRDLLFWAACAAALALIALPAVAIVDNLISQAWPVLGAKLLGATTADGGLQNDLLGSSILSLGVLLLAGPIGVCGGIYLAEFSPRRRGSALRLGYELLAGVPSIVVGFVAYTVLDLELHWGLSLLAGMLALSAIALPYVVKTTELALAQAPSAYRDGAAALGLSRLTGLRRALLPAALPAIASGLVVALAIAVGETAPLLYTVGFSDRDPSGQLLQHPVAYLTYTVYFDALNPSVEDHQLAAAAGVFLIGLIVVLILLGGLVGRLWGRSATA